MKFYIRSICSSEIIITIKIEKVALDASISDRLKKYMDQRLLYFTI